MTIFKTMTLRSKLILGFATILILLVFTSLLGISKLSSSSQGFTSYRDMARDTNLSGRIQANMLMARMSVKGYLINGNESDREEFQKYYEKMYAFLERAGKDIEHHDRAAKIDQIEEDVIRYRQAFEEVVSLTEQYDHLKQDSLDVYGPRLEALLSDVMGSSERSNETATLYNAGNAMKHLLAAKVYETQFFISHSSSDARKVTAEFESMQEDLNRLAQTMASGTQQEALANIRGSLEKYMEGHARAQAVQEKRDKIVTGVLDRIGPSVASLIEEIKLDIKGVQDQIGPRLQASNLKGQKFIALLSLAALLVGITVVFFLTRSVLSQLGCDPAQIAEVAHSIANGDLLVEFHRNGKHEIQGVYKDMETMAVSLRELFTDINSGVHTLTTSASELTDISSQMVSGSAQTSDRSNTVAAAAEEMNVNITSVSAATEQASSNINMVAAALEEMTSTINEIAQNTSTARNINDEAVALSKHASSKIDTLGKSANEISKVTEAINEISQQTNLLALNATIEAARAGEAGKGFSVVASEIKALAIQTSDATLEIKGQVDGIQGATADAIHEIQSISDIIDQLNELVTTIASSIEEQSVTSKEIADNIAQASMGTEEITVSMSQSATVSGEIAHDISEVDQAATEMLNSSTLVGSNVDTLKDLADHLEGKVSAVRF
ncbi:HAMP domain-containing methyl-accepting chemotaxis protein [Desulfoluna spongiiphila]|uniref:HAMP domain-containing methyl-accepting chemotaxis protein n=1 Tax=Desulfoluna spongiiphila TaxID=419481 RepID=UPI0012547B61|nr:methyl-accepting chemotaxis protein [Desulfoluna spongiiphila]VVS91279.1 methyl-accepting chemotaxis protein (mcp) signalling domain [Desulfoluna spongiiphila]